MKKVFCISGGSYIGGAEKVTLNVLSGLKNKGHEIFCLTNSWNDGDFHQRLQEMEIPYKAIKLGWLYLRKPLWTLDTLLHLPHALAEGRKALRQVPHDLIYTNSYRQISLLAPWISKPVFFHVHDPHAQDRQFRWLLARIDPKIKTYIAVSDFVRRDLIEAGVKAEKIKVIYNGVEIPERLPVRRHSSRNPLTLGIVGQVIPRKGHEDVIEALSLLNRQGKNNFRLIIAGKGDAGFEQMLKNLIQESGLTEKVAWRGFQRSLCKIYEDIDLLLAPTRNAEPFALIALEANSLRIPCIVSNMGGFIESIQHQYNGLVVPPNDPREIAATIGFFLENPETLKQMGENGYRNVKDKFSLEMMQKKVRALLMQ